jgi:hypothetical protein
MQDNVEGNDRSAELSKTAGLCNHLERQAGAGKGSLGPFSLPFAAIGDFTVKAVATYAETPWIN